MIKYFIVFFSLFPITFYANEKLTQSIQLTPEQIESIFLEQNLDLIAEKMNINKADADIIQAKLWDNPELSVSDVNLWSTKRQRGFEDDLIPPVFGSFAKNTEFVIELSQLIQTANKRNKLIRREKASKEIAIQEFENVLRGLKIELRKSICEIACNQKYLQILNAENESLTQLVEAYQKQEKKDNLSKEELFNIQSSLLSLENEINEVQVDLNENLKVLKTLLYADPSVYIEIKEENKSFLDPSNLLLQNLIQTAFENRPEINRQKSETKYHKNSLEYEKSLRIPDFTFTASYDRYCGIWENYVSFGISFEIPVLNRNQGAIKAAKISIDQSQYLTQQQQNIIQQEIAQALSNYTQAYTFYNKLESNELFAGLEDMLSSYTKDLQKNDLSMSDYIDFMDTYKTNKQTELTAKKKLDILFEELQYTVSSDLK